ncbi:MAG: hypothetical protein ACI4W2_06015 [Eubacterium sp.]
MSRKKKSADSEEKLRKIILATAALNLITSIITLIAVIVKLI